MRILSDIFPEFKFEDTFSTPNKYQHLGFYKPRRYKTLYIFNFKKMNMI